MKTSTGIFMAGAIVAIGFAMTPQQKTSGLDLGKRAPNFKATDQNGTSFKLSDYRGKVVVIDFWGDW